MYFWPQLTCFISTSTKVQILTPEEWDGVSVKVKRGGKSSKGYEIVPGTSLTNKVLTLLVYWYKSTNRHLMRCVIRGRVSTTSAPAVGSVSRVVARPGLVTCVTRRVFPLHTRLKTKSSYTNNVRPHTLVAKGLIH